MKTIVTMFAIILLKVSCPVRAVAEGVVVGGALPLVAAVDGMEFKPDGIACPRPSLWNEYLHYYTFMDYTCINPSQ